jgi:hypothetical protein
MNPSFDASGIPEAESLRRGLATEMAQLAAESQQQSAPVAMPI